MDKNKQGITLMQEQKYEEAANLFNEVIEENPDDPLGYINFGNLLLHLKDYERAKRFFNKAIELDSKSATAYYGLGNLLFEQSDYSEAINQFQKAEQLGLTEADVYFMIGLSLVNQEQFKFALPYLLRATELSPDDDEIQFQYGLTLAQSNALVEAKQVFLNILNRNTEHADTYYNLGVIELYDENVDKALNYFNKALKVQPDHLLAANGKKNIERLQEDTMEQSED